MGYDAKGKNKYGRIPFYLNKNDLQHHLTSKSGSESAGGGELYCTCIASLLNQSKSPATSICHGIYAGCKLFGHTSLLFSASCWLSRPMFFSFQLQKKKHHYMQQGFGKIFFFSLPPYSISGICF
jgi:hypothetical protein